MGRREWRARGSAAGFESSPVAGECGDPNSLTSGRDFHGSGGKEYREEHREAAWPSGGRVRSMSAKDLGENVRFSLASRADPQKEADSR